jgi:LmbE family N-acetylglucosaminyl deacetylase
MLDSAASEMASFLELIDRALVIAPHPDDEVLGCGGTIARLTAHGREVHIAVMTRGMAPRFDPASAEAVRAEAHEAHALLGVAETHWHDFPAAELDRVAHADLNTAMQHVVAQVAPDTMFVPFVGDIHLDHQLVFASAMVAARPRGAVYPVRIYAYETMSETNWNAPGVTAGFQPNVFVDISRFAATKAAAFGCFGSQVQSFPSERSQEALAALARFRGSTVYREAAEAFMLLREVG